MLMMQARETNDAKYPMDAQGNPRQMFEEIARGRLREARLEAGVGKLLMWRGRHKEEEIISPCFSEGK